MTTIAAPDFAELRARSTGPIHTPEDAGWDAARQAWNLAVDQRPAAVVHPVDADDVVAAVRFAREAGMQVAAQGTGHNAGPLGSLEGTLLVKTSRMREVSIDPVARRARVGAGALWDDVVGPAAEHGLYPLHGSSPDVGVVGYSLGGGMGWLARKHGLQTNSITAVELVPADGELVRADAEHHADLFWALRGGGGNFGVVTALEFALYPVTEVYAGMLVWDWQHSERVLARWAEWAETAPDEVTTSIRIMQLPDIPEVPELIRGRQIVVIDGAYTGEPAAAQAVLRPLRELDPEIDLFGPMPAAALVRLHGDPEEPMPGASDHAVLGALDADAVAAFVRAAGPGSGSQLMMAELRQLGGALGRPAPGAGALPRLDGRFALFAAGLAADAQMGAAMLADAHRLTAAMAPWTTGASYLNFAEVPTDTASGYGEEAYRRLQRIRAEVDPDGLFRANHPIPAAR